MMPDLRTAGAGSPSPTKGIGTYSWAVPVAPVSSPLTSPALRSSSPPLAHQVKNGDERGDQGEEHRKRQDADCGRGVSISKQGEKSPDDDGVENETPSNARNTGGHGPDVKQKGKRPDGDGDGAEWPRGTLDCPAKINEEEEHRHNGDTYGGERETNGSSRVDPKVVTVIHEE